MTPCLANGKGVYCVTDCLYGGWDWESESTLHSSCPDPLPNFKSVPMPLLIMLATVTFRPLHLAAFGSEASYEIFLYFDVCYCSCWLESQNLVGLIVKKMSLCSAK